MLVGRRQSSIRTLPCCPPTARGCADRTTHNLTLILLFHLIHFDSTTYGPLDYYHLYEPHSSRHLQRMGAARRTVCLNHLSQVGMAVMTTPAVNEDWRPHGRLANPFWRMVALRLSRRRMADFFMPAVRNARSGFQSFLFL